MKPAYLAGDYQRLWDLVRYQRAELHEAGLITDEEYAVLVAGEPSRPGTGSPSAQRLSSYDELRKALAAITAERDALREARDEAIAHARDLIGADAALTRGRGVAMRAHFVTFYSPGTFVAEDTTKPIAAWDTTLAMEMAHDIVERYGATPYGFTFSTRERADDDLDSRVVATSPMHFIGCTVLTLDQIVKRGDVRDAILISNMQINHWDRVVTTAHGWRWTQPIEPGDVVLDWQPRLQQQKGAGQ